MLTGYNTDVVFEGVVYHVQTEDRGLEAPVLDTLVYCGGQILHQDKISYEDLIESCEEGEPLELKLAPRLDQQHRNFVRRTRHGEFAEAAATLSDLVEMKGGFGEALETFIESDEQIEPLTLTWVPSTSNSAGLCGKLIVSRVEDGRTVEGASVTARLIARGLNPVALLEATTDSGGETEVAVALPPGSGAAVVFSASQDSAEGRLRMPIDPEEEVSPSGREEPAESPAPESSS